MVVRAAALCSALALGGCSLWPGAAAKADCPSEITRASAWATKSTEGTTTHVLVRYEALDAPLDLVLAETRMETDVEAGPPGVLQLTLRPHSDSGARRDQARYRDLSGVAYERVEILCADEIIHVVGLVKQVR